MSTGSSIIAPAPPHDGRDWDAQCARCGSSVTVDPCSACGGDGVEGHDCGEDTCLCLHPEPNLACYVCGGLGSFARCLSDRGWCEGHPLEGREATARGAIEWFIIDRASVIRIRQRLRAFYSADQAERWLEIKHPGLGCTPAEALDRGDHDDVLALIEQLETGAFA